MRLWEARGRFIVFDGLNGSGCSTQSKLLTEFLKQRGQTVVLTSEPNPNGTAIHKIRDVLVQKKSITPKQLQKLFVDDRREHLRDVIIPGLRQGITVVCDRYFFSTIAFGSIDLDPDWLVSINKKFLVPDISIIMSVPPEICIERIQKDGTTKEIFEKFSKLKKAWETYTEIPKLFPNVFLLDGTSSINEVHHQITKVVLSKL
jgi:dTMP kinase